MIASTLLANVVIDAARPITPTPASPTALFETSSMPCMPTRPLTPRPSSGHEKLAYSLTVPRSQRKRVG